MKQLDPLPPSNDEYWEHAEVEKIKLEDSPKCKHYFVRMGGSTVECRKCRMGYYITPEFQVKQGHIYNFDQLVV